VEIKAALVVGFQQSLEAQNAQSIAGPLHTVRYLGVEVDDALELSEALEL
jgi:hypothetical protein